MIGTVAISNWIASLFKNVLIPYVIGIFGFALGIALPHEMKILSYFFPYCYLYILLMLKDLVEV